MPPFRKIWDVATCLNGDSCGGEFAQMQIHSWMPAFSNSKFANPKLVCMQYGVTSMLLITAHTPAVMWVRQSFYGIIKLVAYNFQKLLHNHHPHSYRGMEPFCCTNFLDVCTQGRLPRISARKYISWEFPFCLKGFETKVTLSDLMSLQLGNLAQAY